MKKHHAVAEQLVPHNKASLDETWKGDKSPSVAANCCGCMWFFSANLSPIRMRNRPFDPWLRQFQISGAYAKSIAPGPPPCSLKAADYKIISVSEWCTKVERS